MAGHPPPLELYGRLNLATESFKKAIFSLIARPLKEELFLRLPLAGICLFLKIGYRV